MLLSRQGDPVLDDILQHIPNDFSDCKPLPGYAQQLHKPLPPDHKVALPRGVWPIRNFPILVPDGHCFERALLRVNVEVW